MYWALVSLVVAGTTADRPIDRILESGDYQRELPEATAAPSKTPNELPRPSSPPIVRAPPAPAPAVGAAVGWIALGILLVVLVAWAIPAFRHRARPPAEASANGSPEPAAVAEPTTDSISPHDYGAAIHRLLLRALDHLGHRGEVPRSATAWAIVRQTSDSALRDPLTGLVRGVEAARWALTPVGPSEYQECLDHFRTLEERLGTADRVKAGS